ncbi:MAG: four helix bundle protein [Chloroflexi bacterium]|nr:four helix bundle protein [Chloroflexota bacterium]
MGKSKSSGQHAEKFQSFEAWVEQVPLEIKEDPLWKFEAYPLALFLCDLAWFDCDHLMRDDRGRAVAWQLIDSAGSVGANIEEGYGRGFGKDYARFLKISVGSARETRGWYYRGRHLLSADVLKHRMKLISQIIALLVKTIQRYK